MICTPTPTDATAVAPRRPTISMSSSPTSDSIENEKMTGQASAHVVRRRSAHAGGASSAASEASAGAVTALCTGGRREGLVGLQLHGGMDMTVEFRDMSMTPK